MNTEKLQRIVDQITAEKDRTGSGDYYRGVRYGLDDAVSILFDVTGHHLCYDRDTDTSKVRKGHYGSCSLCAR